MSVEIGRRAFVARASRLLAAGAFVTRYRDLRAGAPPLRIGVALRSGDADSRAVLGARLGAEEATHSAALFGAGAVELSVGKIEAILDHDVVAILAADPSLEECLRLSGLAGQRDALFVNVSCGADVLRGDQCRATTFHVAPSDTMLADALAEARHQVGVPARNDIGAAAWDSSLERFGADTLNNRFRTRFGKPMTADAWCAWVGVKILAEGSLRAHSVDSRAISAFLRRDNAQFDGHKGRPLSFRAWDNQLRQPVYVMTRASSGASRLVLESPISGPTDAPSRDVLDRIGTTARATTCRIAP